MCGQKAEETKVGLKQTNKQIEYMHACGGGVRAGRRDLGKQSICFCFVAELQDSSVQPVSSICRAARTTSINK